MSEFQPEAVNDSNQPVVFVDDKHTMDFIIVHHVVNICDFGIGAYTFGVACHIVCHRAMKDVCMICIQRTLS